MATVVSLAIEERVVVRPSFEGAGIAGDWSIDWYQNASVSSITFKGAKSLRFPANGPPLFPRVSYRKSANSLSLAMSI
jgi:hypothetical protein